MLKITRHCDAASVTLKLEGALRGPWTLAAADECARAASGDAHLRLDLAAVTYVDDPGLRLLRELIGRGASITTCSAFIAQLLNLEKP